MYKRHGRKRTLKSGEKCYHKNGKSLDKSGSSDREMIKAAEANLSRGSVKQNNAKF